MFRFGTAVRRDVVPFGVPRTYVAFLVILSHAHVLLREV